MDCMNKRPMTILESEIATGLEYEIKSLRCKDTKVEVTVNGNTCNVTIKGAQALSNKKVQEIINTIAGDKITIINYRFFSAVDF